MVIDLYTGMQTNIFDKISWNNCTSYNL